MLQLRMTTINRTSTSPSNDMTLEQITARLSQNEVVTGLLLIGSAARGELTPTSDVDLVVVLSEMPVPLHVGVTYIDGTLTDLIFLRAAQIGKALGSVDIWGKIPGCQPSNYPMINGQRF
jgi:predicted nucleotidyltransferase